MRTFFAFIFLILSSPAWAAQSPEFLTILVSKPKNCQAYLANPSEYLNGIISQLSYQDPTMGLQFVEADVVQVQDLSKVALDSFDFLAVVIVKITFNGEARRHFYIRNLRNIEGISILLSPEDPALDDQNPQ